MITAQSETKIRELMRKSMALTIEDLGPIAIEQMAKGKGKGRGPPLPPGGGKKVALQKATEKHNPLQCRKAECVKLQFEGNPPDNVIAEPEKVKFINDLVPSNEKVPIPAQGETWKTLRDNYLTTSNQNIQACDQKLQNLSDYLYALQVRSIPPIDWQKVLLALADTTSNDPKKHSIEAAGGVPAYEENVQEWVTKNAHAKEQQTPLSLDEAWNKLKLNSIVKQFISDELMSSRGRGLPTLAMELAKARGNSKYTVSFDSPTFPEQKTPIDAAFWDQHDPKFLTKTAIFDVLQRVLQSTGANFCRERRAQVKSAMRPKAGATAAGPDADQKERNAAATKDLKELGFADPTKAPIKTAKDIMKKLNTRRLLPTFWVALHRAAVLIAESNSKNCQDVKVKNYAMKWETELGAGMREWESAESALNRADTKDMLSNWLQIAEQSVPPKEVPQFTGTSLEAQHFPWFYLKHGVSFSEETAKTAHLAKAMTKSEVDGPSLVNAFKANLRNTISAVQKLITLLETCDGSAKA
jgi:hypothetical protein